MPTTTCSTVRGAPASARAGRFSSSMPITNIAYLSFLNCGDAVVAGAGGGALPVRLGQSRKGHRGSLGHAQAELEKVSARIHVLVSHHLRLLGGVRQ